MLRFLSQRLLVLIPVLLGVSMLSFLLLYLIPGDVVDILMGQESGDPARLAEMRQLFGIDRPLAVRYAEWLGEVLRGDLGRSFVTRRPVLSEIMTAFPVTLQLTAASLFVALAAGLPLGILAAVRRGSASSIGTSLLVLLVLSIPSFWLGILLIMLFAVQLRLLPTSGTGDWRHLILPGLTLASFILPQVTLLTRSSMLDVLNEQYIMAARAKGLGEPAVMLHALKNAVHPVITYLGLQMGTLVGGSIITETIFSWPGVGQLTIQSIYNRDVVVVEAAVLVMALAIVLSNLLADVINAGLDPRIRIS